jgi:hypothetical protein
MTGDNNALALLKLLIGLVLDAMEALVSIVARYSSNGMALEVIVLGKPTVSFKPLGDLLCLVMETFSKN